jgi:hypothetical protein
MNNQSYTQSFDNMQPFNSSSEQLILTSSASMGIGKTAAVQKGGSGIGNVPR